MHFIFTVCVQNNDAVSNVICLCVLLQTKTINIMYAVREDVQGLVRAIDTVCMKAAQAARDGYQLIVLSDKLAGKRLVPIRWTPFDWLY